MQPSQPVIRLYPGAAPGSEHWTHQEQEGYEEAWQAPVVYNVTDPTLIVFAPAPDQANGTAVVVCPGGGFHGLSIVLEGYEVARWLAARGITCFVLKYRLVECKSGGPNATIQTQPGGDGFGPEFGPAIADVVKLAHADGLAAVTYVRAHAADYGIDPHRIGIMGFSAGGTLAASVALTHPPTARPDFVAPIYLDYGWSIKDGIPDDAPPLFAAAATDDVRFAPESIRIYQDWVAADKPAELHLFGAGGHGFSMRQLNLPCDRWLDLFAAWLVAQGLLPA